MSTKMKILVSSLASIALCISLITGATYAMFTSEARTSVSVTAANVSIEAEHSGLVLKSMGEAQPELVFENGGTAKIDGNNIILKNITPGDSIEFTISMTNTSNIAIQCRTRVEKTVTKEGATEEELAALLEGLVITIDGVVCTGDSNKSAWEPLAAVSELDPEPMKTVSVSITLPEEKGNEYQGAVWDLTYVIEAIQSNAELPE